MWFCFDGCDFETYETEEAAKSAAVMAFESCQDAAPEGWPEETDQVCWGKVRQKVAVTASYTQEEAEALDKTFDPDWGFLEERELLDVVDAKTLDQLIAEFRESRDALLPMVAEEFPDGSRVQPKGTTTGNWGATIVPLDEHDRKATAADHVFLKWDNGNRFETPIDGLELLPVRS